MLGEPEAGPVPIGQLNPFPQEAEFIHAGSRIRYLWPAESVQSESRISSDEAGESELVSDSEMDVGWRMGNPKRVSEVNIRF